MRTYTDTMIKQEKFLLVQIMRFISFLKEIRSIWINILGYGDLQIGWTDGNSFIPVSATLVTSSKDELIVSNHVKSVDKRTCVHRIREQA